MKFQEIRFSRSVVIAPLDDTDQRPALMIRIADIQHRLYLAESHVRLYMARTRINSVSLPGYLFYPFFDLVFASL
jgi:hypothetical protein